MRKHTNASVVSAHLSGFSQTEHTRVSDIALVFPSLNDLKNLSGVQI